eukprot:TRINITY_DN7592_c0_g2_i1.p1 TRINITY_DN7592_c0_g2~~TRINITY_DN7592_c0_g2_i1.p1  ORF type:complete len:118 (-),score=18.54 TRINITY_DN7592_c0_g2_i1:273-626(-)
MSINSVSTTITNWHSEKTDYGSTEQIDEYYQKMIESDPSERKRIEKKFIVENLKRNQDTTDVFVLNNIWAQNYSNFLQNLHSNPIQKISNEIILQEMEKKQRRLEENSDYVIINSLV